MINLTPVHDNLIIKLEEIKLEEETPSGIILSNAGKTEQMLRKSEGEVIAVGEGRRLSNGTLLPTTAKVGQKVLFNKFAGTEIESEEGKFLIIKESDILAIFN